MAKRIHTHNLISTPQLRSLFNTASVQYLFTAPNAPQRAIVVSNRSGNYQLHAVDFLNGFNRQITRKRGGSLFGSISGDGKYIFVLNDKQGGEHGHFLKIPFEGGKSIDLTPRLKPYFSYSISSSGDGNTLCFTAAVDNKNNVFVTRIGNGTSNTERIYSSNSSLTESICSPDGRYICVSQTDARTRLGTLLLLPTARDERVIRSRSFNFAVPLSFLRASETPTILALARIDNWLRPIFYNFEKQRIETVQHENFHGDIWVLRWDEDRGEMILCDAHQARHTLHRYNTRTRELERIGPKTGSFNFHFNSAARLDDGSLIVKWNDFNTSPRLIRLHAPHYKTWEEMSEWSGNVKTQYMVQSVWTRSSDGERVQMWVAEPKEIKKSLSFVIDVHGGPHGVVGDEFSPEAQTWLASGFGYCAVNYRGSIGFGKKFERKIYGNPGRWEVEDVVAARNWLIRNRNADPDHIILYGWSWGGYVTLLALGKYPGLWNCGVAGAAITDCIMQYEDEPVYFKSRDQERFRGTPKTARLRFVRSSPITYADRIQAPVLLLHGKNDMRCPPRQIKYFVKTLKKMNKNVSVVWFTLGHTGEFTDVSLRSQLMGKILHFVTAGKRMPLKNKKVS